MSDLHQAALARYGKHLAVSASGCWSGSPYDQAGGLMQHGLDAESLAALACALNDGTPVDAAWLESVLGPEGDDGTRDVWWYREGLEMNSLVVTSNSLTDYWIVTHRSRRAVLGLLAWLELEGMRQP